MSLATLVKTDLFSLPIRLATVDSKDGNTLRKIEPPEPVKLPGKKKGFLSWALKAIFKATGWLIKGLMPVIGGVATFIAQTFVNQVNIVMNFNWNATDAELDNRIAQNVNALGSLLGGALGEFLGFATVGSAAGVVLYKFNPLLAVKVLWDVGEEALQSLGANVFTITRNILNIYAQWQMTQAFKAWRWTAKKILSDPNSPISKFAKKWFGQGFVNSVKQWGEKGSKPWTFAQERDKLIENLPDGFIENFFEELIEEWWDGATEALFIVASDFDEYIAEQQIEKAVKFGAEEVVEIVPNRDVPEEKIVLAGPQELIKPVIVQTMTQHQLLDNRDVGMWVGEPIREFVKSAPMSIQLRIVMSSKEDTVVRAKRVQITIPAVNRAKLDWADIKNRVGGVNGYMWGRYEATAQLTNGHKMRIWAATDAEAVDRITQLAWLSEEEVLGISVREEKREGSRKTINALYKQATRIYPYGMTIINQRKVLNEESGLAQLSGTYKRKKTSLIPLYVDTRPDDFSEVIAELFRVPGPND